MNRRYSPPELPSVLLSDQLNSLPIIFEQHCQAAIWKRPAPDGVVNYLETLNVAGRLGIGLRTTIAPGERLTIPELPEAPDREAMLADVALLADIYGELLGCPRVGLRLEVLHQAMCPRFHVDRTGIRLLCTYRGPGTECLPDGAADRSRLGIVSAGIPDEHSGVVVDADKIVRVPSHALVLLKGSLWQGNKGLGAIHRSPALQPADAPRVVLALDAIW